MFSYAGASEKDIFKVAQEYGKELSEKKAAENETYVIEIIDEGATLDEVVNSFVDESIINKLVEDKEDIQVNDYNDDESDNDKDYSSYFANTKDYTDINISRKDTLLNKWASINPEYDKYDNGGADDITIIATAYTASIEECGKDDGITASGKLVSPGCIAAPRDIPFGTKIRVSGLGVFNVEDRGGAIVRVSDNIIRIDVWMESYNEAIKFGKRVYKGKILK